MDILGLTKTYGDLMAESGAEHAYALIGAKSDNSLELLESAQYAANVAEAAFGAIADVPFTADILPQIAAYGAVMYKWGRDVAIWAETDNPEKGRMADIWYDSARFGLNQLKMYLKG